jgi:hypothetical protein
MEQEIHITLRFNLANGKVGLNEIVYKLKELRYPLKGGTVLQLRRISFFAIKCMESGAECAQGNKF